MVATAVIRIGRSRRRPPSTTASRTPMPCARYWLIRSISTIALVTTMPTSISTPISAGTPSGVPVTSSRPIAPVAANGIETSRISGWSEAAERRHHDHEDDRDRGQHRQAQVGERLRLVRADAADRERRAGRHVERVQPLLSAPCVVAPRFEPVAVPVTVALRSPSIRVTCSGPSTSRDVGDVVQLDRTHRRCQRQRLAARRSAGGVPERAAPRPAAGRRALTWPSGAAPERLRRRLPDRRPR